MPEQRRSRGSYSITKRGNKYEATYNIPQSVPRKRVSAWGTTERIAISNLLEKLRSQGTPEPLAPEREPGNTAAGHSYTFRRWAEEWFAGYTQHLQSETRVRYRGHLDNHILPHIGSVTLDKLSAKVLNDKWWKVIQEKKKVKGGVLTEEPLLSNAGLANVYKTAKMVLQTAHDKIGSPMKLTPTLFHAPSGGSRPETNAEVATATRKLARLFNEELAHDDERWARYLFSLLGLRQAERLGLTVSSIDLTRGEEKLIISQQLEWNSEEGKLRLKPATKNGEPREVPLWGIYLEAAKLLLARYKKISKSPDFSPPEEFKNLLMLQEGGRVLTRQADTKGWRALTGGDIRGHLARHATAQLLAENGLSQDVAKLILGHKSDAYAHYYRTISTTHAGRQMRDNYQLGENTVPRRLRAV